MILLKADIATVLKCIAAGLLMFSSFAFAQTRSSAGQFSVSITLNGVASVPAGTCASQTLFNQTGAVVRVTCVDNPFVSIAPLIDTQLPGTFGSTFRYPTISSLSSYNVATASSSSLNPVDSTLNGAGVSSLFVDPSASTGLNVQSAAGRNVVNRNFNSPTSTVTDMTIYRTAPQTTTDPQGLMDMIISF